MKFLVIAAFVLFIFALAWQHDAKSCYMKGWNFSLGGQCYDENGFVRIP